MSAPLLTTPCGSSVPVGRSTVWTLDGTVSLNSIQLMRSISRVATMSRGAGGRVCACDGGGAQSATVTISASATADTKTLISLPSSVDEQNRER